MTIVIITALDLEYNSVKSQLNNIKEIDSIYKVITGESKNHNIFLGLTTPGKVSAAGLTQHLIDQYKPELIISLGISGGISKGLKVGDVLLSNRFIQYDYVIGFREKGFNWNPAYKSEILETNIPKKVLPICKNLFGTGDSFIHKEAEKILLTKIGVTACDMESAAVAQISYLNKIDCLSIRGISDLGEGTPKDFKKHMRLAINNSITSLNNLLSSLN